MKPLPDAPVPQDVQDPTCLVADLLPPLPPSSKVESGLDDPGVKDLGWSNNSMPPTSLIRGTTNDELFMLIRRFNKQVQHVRALPPPPPVLLDLEIADDEEFSPDKLRANLERLYMTVIVGMAAFAKHITRLRSWNEPRRTVKFAAVYFVAWYLSVLPAAIVTIILVLIFHPPSRRAMFPPAPLAAVSGTSGNLQVPRAGTLGTPDSLSGAPEAHQGEAVEQEASQFVASFAAIGAGTVMGQGGAPAPKQHGKARADVTHGIAGETEIEVGSQTSEDSTADGLSDPTDFALEAKNVKDTANSDGVEDPAAHVAKKSIEGAVWEKMRPVMRILADIADTWERFGNILAPVAPFPKWAARIRLAGVLLPMLVASLVVPFKIVVDGTTFLIGFLFFSQPILSRVAYKLTHRFPNWRKYLELRRTLLRGVPTNIQLTITLLRVAELAKAPLPPPPIARPHHTAAAADAANPAPEHSPQAAHALKAHDFAFDTDKYEIEGVDRPDAHTDEGSNGHGEAKKKKHGSKLVGLIRKTTRAGVGSVLSVDHIKATIGSEHSKRRLGIVPPRNANSRVDEKEVAEREREAANAQGQDKELMAERADVALKREGPTSFSARMHGKKGRILLVTSAASPCLSFVTEKPLRAALQASSIIPGKGGDESEGLNADFTIGVNDVVSVRKMGGFGWKGKLVVGWAMGRDVLDGLEVVDKFGTRKVFTAIKGRDELFNRLASVGGQSWECL
ncbi:hypothetical protein C8Q74DRAFT_1191507 [Fomes fomentarius]|nr:hypothetical protein C8Q74DRAFT_1191507 [Fomes fomentarius]